MAQMQKFNYVARDSSGREVKGILDAETEGDAMGRLRQKQLTIVKLEKVAAGINWNMQFGGKAPRKCTTSQLCLFTRQLATMIGAGIRSWNPSRSSRIRPRTRTRGSAKACRSAPTWCVQAPRCPKPCTSTGACSQRSM